MNLASTTITTPWQPLSIVVDISDSPVVVAAAFQSMKELLFKARFEDEKVATAISIPGITEVVTSWIDGNVNAFDTVRVRQAGGEFMQQCWDALRTVRGGTVVSYGQLAGLAGRPLASRAAGTACASNLVAPFIPCHRVVRASGDIGNYGFGVNLKRALLAHEGVHL